ncbi:MAG: glycoside hydrolase family 43 protein [Lachnospiraceae bacterium]|nr:glycoside hydrolase family 43 protein [Lachnospiraceae bacterium]
MEKKYNNPVHRGFLPDPSVIRVGDGFFKVNSSFQYFPAIPISYSKDLVHWKIVSYAITENEWLDLSETLDSRGIWAPDISYGNGKYYIFAPLRYNSDDKAVHPMRAQLVMTSDKPEGPYSKPVILDVDDIDPSHFVDDDGKHYMVIAPGATVIPLNDDCTKVIGEPVQVWAGTGERCSEGPHIFKKDGWYYAMVAEGGTGYGHGINIARSKSLYGEYEACPYNPVMRQKNPDELIQRAGHGMLVETQNGEWWCMYLCGRRNGGNYTTIGRETALDRVTWTEDGWFLINDGKGPSKEAVAPDLEWEIYEPFTFDDFDSDKIDINWLWVRNPDETAYSLTDNKGHLRLYTLDGQLFEVKAKNTLVKREEELSYMAETKMFFNPNEKEQAGLVCYYSTKTYASFSLRKLNGEDVLVLAINRNQGEEIMNTVKNVKPGEIYLRVVVDGLVRRFYYSYDANEWHEAGVLESCTFLCDEGVPEDRKRHTGTLVGLYANNGGTGTRNYADFDNFRYQNRG